MTSIMGKLSYVVPKCYRDDAAVVCGGSVMYHVMLALECRQLSG